MTEIIELPDIPPLQYKAVKTGNPDYHQIYELNRVDPVGLDTYQRLNLRIYKSKVACEKAIQVLTDNISVIIEPKYGVKDAISCRHRPFSQN